MDEAAQALGDKGEFAIITSSLIAENQDKWIKNIKPHLEEKYPDIKLAALRPCDDMKDKAFSEATAILNSNPNVKVPIAVCSPAVSGAAEAVKQNGRKDVKVVGLGLPNENKRYVHNGITTGVVLWNTEDLGYLTVYAAKAVADGALKPGASTLKAGRLGSLEVKGDNVLLGKPFIFVKNNIDQFNF
jgi:ABC-type sugar transport system substrate-binding protein